jgi:hypothetical protein
MLPESVAVGDFNGDGKLDLVVANRGLGEGTVSVLLGNGDGTFQAAQTYDVAPYPVAVAVGDFNGDGYPDLAVANSTDPGAVTVLLNAADWGGGAGAAPPPTPALPPRAHRQLPMRAVSVLVAGAQPQGLPLRSLISADDRSNALQQSPVETAAGQLTKPTAPLSPRPLLTVRHAQDAIFERWSDPVVDMLAIDSWK